MQIEIREPGMSFIKEIDNLEEFAEIYKNRGPAVSLLNSKGIICSCGIVMGWKGVGEAWVYGSNEISKHKAEFHRIVKYLLDKTIKDFKLRRIQASIDEDYTTGYKWAKRLGFVEEGRMVGYGANGHTHILMAIIKPVLSLSK